MGNLSTYFAYKNRIADIHNKLYSITSKLKKTASSIGFINKAIYHNVISQFAQIEGQFLNRHEHTQGSTQGSTKRCCENYLFANLYWVNKDENM